MVSGTIAHMEETKKVPKMSELRKLDLIECTAHDFVYAITGTYYKVVED